MKREASESSVKKDEWLNIVRQSAALLRAIASCRVPSTPLLPLTRPSSPAHPTSRLVVLQSLPPTLTHDVAESAIKRTCKLYGGLYREGIYLPVSADTTQHCGHAVLELCCDVHTSAVCSALLATPNLQQEGHAPMQALAVNNLLSCGEQEPDAKATLISFLRWRLGKGPGKVDESAVLAVLGDIFTSSCPESESALAVSQVSGPLLKFFNKFALLCAVSTENFVGGVWEEFANEKGLLNLDGFRKCYEQDFKLNAEYASRGVWLGLLECGYDFHLDRSEFPLPPKWFIHVCVFCVCVFVARYPCEAPQDAGPSPITPPQDQALVRHVDSLCRRLSGKSSSLQPWDITVSEAETTSQHLSPLQGQ